MRRILLTLFLICLSSRAFSLAPQSPFCETVMERETDNPLTELILHWTKLARIAGNSQVITILNVLAENQTIQGFEKVIRGFRNSNKNNKERKKDLIHLVVRWLELSDFLAANVYSSDKFNFKIFTVGIINDFFNSEKNRVKLAKYRMREIKNSIRNEKYKLGFGGIKTPFQTILEMAGLEEIPIVPSINAAYISRNNGKQRGNLLSNIQLIDPKTEASRAKFKKLILEMKASGELEKFIRNLNYVGDDGEFAKDLLYFKTRWFKLKEYLDSSSPNALEDFRLQNFTYKMLLLFMSKGKVNKLSKFMLKNISDSIDAKTYDLYPNPNYSPSQKIIEYSGVLSMVYEAIFNHKVIFKHIDLIDSMEVLVRVKDAIKDSHISHEWDALSGNTVFEGKFRSSLKELFGQFLGYDFNENKEKSGFYLYSLNHAKLPSRHQKIKNFVFWGENTTFNFREAFLDWAQDNEKYLKLSTSEKSFCIKLSIEQFIDFLKSEKTIALLSQELKSSLDVEALMLDLIEKRNGLIKALTAKGKFDVIVGVSNFFTRGPKDAIEGPLKDLAGTST